MEFTRKNLHNKFLTASTENTSANISANYMYYDVLNKQNLERKLKKTIISNSF